MRLLAGSFALSWILSLPCSADSILNANVLDPTAFRVTQFATGLTGPLSLLQLPDKSLLVGTGFGSANLLRFTSNGNGVADGPGTSLYTGGVGPVLGLHQVGKYVAVDTETDHAITFLQPGSSPAAPLTPVASLQLTYPANWEHNQPAFISRPTPGSANSYDLILNVGSQYDNQASTGKVALSGLATGTLDGDSLYKITIDESGSQPVASGLTKIASGIRNVAGVGFQAGSGDFYFTDNAIDGPGPDGDEPPQADELNRISAASFGLTQNFGYPDCYVQYRTGQSVGNGCTQPLVAFQPLPNGTALGAESEGPVELAFAPSSFPAGFNNGIFVGFFGKFATGTANEEDAVVYVDLATLSYVHFVESGLPNTGNPIGLLSTPDSLFISDFGTGIVYQVSAASVPEPTSGTLLVAGLIALAVRRRKCKLP